MKGRIILNWIESYLKKKHKSYIGRQILKEKQRKELLKGIKGGTVLELFAGEGILSRMVYSNIFDKIIAVDKDKEALKILERRVKGRVELEIYNMDNIRFCEDILPKLEIKDLKCVDFDAYGSPILCIRSFFKNYKIKNELCVALTDGIGAYLARKDEEARRKFIKENYNIEYTGKWSREKQKEIIDMFMKKLGERYGFEVEFINEDIGRQWAIFKGYKVYPL